MSRYPHNGWREKRIEIEYALDSLKERNVTMLKLALRYARYAVVTLTSVGFALVGN
jgi:hypothetical protein